MDEFFSFMAAQCVAWWFAEVQYRKLSGERGAPRAEHLGFAKAVHAPGAAEAFAALEARVWCDRSKSGSARASRGYDLVTRESPNLWRGRRIYLIDDVARIDELVGWWRGALWIQQTSVKKFQALLIHPRGESDDERFRRGVKALATRFHGDPAACRINQLHRLPGSKNCKAERIAENGGTPFATTKVFAREAIDADAALRQIDEISQITDSPPRPIAAPSGRRAGPIATGSGACQRDFTNSGAAFVWTLRSLKAGMPDTEILARLSTEFLGKHDPKDWPVRTLWNAKHALGIVPDRYKSS